MANFILDAEQNKLTSVQTLPEQLYKDLGVSRTSKKKMGLPNNNGKT